jgi:hypothetical protein
VASGDVVRVSHGGHWPALRETADFSLSLSLGLNGSRPFSDQGLRLEDTPSRGKIVKETLSFSLLEPAVLGVIQKLRFFVLKTYFFSVLQKYVF